MDRWTGTFTPAVAFALLVLVVSLVPVPDSGGQAVPALLGVALDKWVHAGSYALLTGLAVRARRQRDLLAVAAVAAVVVGYGADDVRVTEPTYADVFNFYTHLDGRTEEPT